jgi:IS5 family transposase
MLFVSDGFAHRKFLSTSSQIPTQDGKRARLIWRLRAWRASDAARATALELRRRRPATSAPTVIKNLFRHKRARYRGLTMNTAQLHSLFGLASLVIAKGR